MKNSLETPIQPTTFDPARKEGILLVDKPAGKTSFSLVAALRRKTGVQKIGHAGTLDPFATGLMILLIGKNFTRLSDQFLSQDKEYTGTIRLGVTTDTYDSVGTVTSTSDAVPTPEQVKEALSHFQGTVLQTPPMFSAKKVEGKKLYKLARKGVEIERKPSTVTMKTTLLRYEYPFIDIHLTCSKGTYVRTLAYDLGALLGCGAHLATLRRTRCGTFLLQNAIDGSLLYENC